MLTYALMGLLVLGIAIITLWGVKYEPNKNSFMSIEDTTFLRGFWCIIVVLVHVPATYQNRIQDMLGSFAYIGVTFFFMISAYGLKWSFEHKPGYMDHFWRRRLPSILVPAFIANAFEVLMYGLNGTSFTALSFININNWIKVLLIYYFVFWAVYKLAPKLIGGGWQDVAMCLIVVIFSIVDYFTDFKITSRWIVEPLGFAYGIIAANHAEEIKKWLRKGWIRNCVVLMLIAGLIGIAYLKFKPVQFWGDYLLKIALGISITAFMYVVIAKLKVGNKVNSFLGSISYEVYILHHGVFALLTVIFGTAINSGVFVLIAIIITIVMAFLLNRLCQPIVKGIKEIGE